MSSSRPPRSINLSEALPALLARYVPISRWLPAYPRAWFRPDLIAAVTSWGVMVPVALAYAGLAGVPPELGLVTAFAALAAYAVFGTSRHLKVTVSSTMAIMSASVVGDLAGGDAATYVALTAALALTVGVMLVAAGVARLGFIADFLTKSVVTGFIFGLAITIIVGQLPKILGVPGLSGSLPEQVVQLVGSLPDTNPYTLAVGLTALVLILVLRRISRRIPGPLIALVVGIVAVSALGLEAHGVSVVGEVATGVPLPSLPQVPLSSIPFLALGAAGIVFLAVGESVGAGAPMPHATMTRSMPTRRCWRSAPPTWPRACSAASRRTRACPRRRPPRRRARSPSSRRSSRRASSWRRRSCWPPCSRTCPTRSWGRSSSRPSWASWTSPRCAATGRGGGRTS